MEKELKEFQKEWESNENTWVCVAQNLPCTIHKVLIVGMNRKPTSDLSASIKVERSFVFLEFCLKILEQYQSWRYWDIFSSNSFAFKARKVRTFNYPSIYWPPPMFKSNKRNSINLSWSLLPENESNIKQELQLNSPNSQAHPFISPLNKTGPSGEEKIY